MLVSLCNSAMYFIEDEKMARNMQQLNSAGVKSPVRDIDKENFKVTDSILEYHDPTPNIHDLFVLFDKKFFWGKLEMVEVKWSNRMTSCAGLCYYQGRRGLCSIKLSAPLLSLRPRKDLVETLLHEMIHAYLFVTENYQDRDDHGPEFHKHMHRINQQAGTKITVYHSFLEEVAYYQKHIWRCNGSCRNRKPYFGFVKRAMNRAPGPYDTWWKEHQQNCAGTFIKISEPEKACKKKSGHEKDKSITPVTGVKDLRDYFPTGTSQKIISHGVNKALKSTNIHTFKDLKSCSSPANTIVKPKSPALVLSKVETAETSKAIKTDSNTLDINESARVRATVRNFWANKYPSPRVGEKRSVGSTSPIIPVEMKIEMKRKQVTCPVCDLSFSETVINEHVDECLSKSESQSQSQSLDDTLPMDELEQIKNGTSTQNDRKEKDEWSLKLIQCPICSNAVDQEDLDVHLETCLKLSFPSEKIERNDDVCDTVPCPCCMKWVNEHTVNAHIDECLTFIALKNGLKDE